MRMLNAIMVQSDITEEELRESEIPFEEWYLEVRNKVEYRVRVADLDEVEKKWMVDTFLNGMSVSKLEEFNYVIFFEYE